MGGWLMLGVFVWGMAAGGFAAGSVWCFWYARQLRKLRDARQWSALAILGDDPSA